MPTEDYQSSPDERQDQTPTAEELRAAELAKTKQALLVAAAMQQTESQLANRLPTKTAPVQPPPTQVAPPPATPPPSQMQPPAPVQTTAMPTEATPPMLTSPERISRVQQVGQQVQRPMQSTLSESISPPKESHSKYPIKQMLNMGMKPRDIMATVDAARRYDAQRGYQADLAKGIPTQDALAKWGPMLFSGSRGATTSVMPKHTLHNVSGAGYSFDPTTGKANLVTPPGAPNSRETLALEREKRLSATADQQLSPASKEKVKQMGLDIAGMRKSLSSGSLTLEKERQFENDISTLNRMISDEFKKSKQPTSSAAPTPVQAPASQGLPVKDKSGKTWIYTGSSSDPKTDKDPSHWKAQ